MNEIRVSVVDYGRRFLQLRYVDPISGRQKTKSAETADRKEATKAAGKWQSELQEGRYKPASKMTWEEFRERYETDGMASHADATVQKAMTAFSMLEKFHRPKPTHLRDVTTESIARWMASILPGRRPATVSGYARMILGALRWAREQGFLHDVPKFRMPRGDKGGKMMKGRPVVLEEHERMMAVVPKIVGGENAAEWTRLLNGLWWSGLRLNEALRLSWDAGEAISVDVQPGARPVLRIQAAGQKSRRAELLPIAPEFAQMLEAVPEAERAGRVFNLRLPRTENGRVTLDRASRVVSACGEKAGVIVDEASGKFASSHDYRRAFGTRWAKRVMPAVLQRMMRHSEISTTLKFYVAQDAEEVADALWAAYNRAGGNTSGSFVQQNA